MLQLGLRGAEQPECALLPLPQPVVAHSHARSHLEVTRGQLIQPALLHAFGLSTSTGTTPGRFIGTILTWLVILVASALLLYGRFA